MPCPSPFYVQVSPFKSKKGLHEVPVPCGKCPYCKKRRVDSWVFRMMQEDRISDQAHFVTWTYNTEKVPISDNGFMSLSKDQMQLYIKRLRKEVGKYAKKKLKYYIVGEYGSQSFRPHYHGVVFNVPSVAIYASRWNDPDDGIQYGNIDVGSVTSRSIAYCCLYMDKEARVPLHKRDDREPEFSLFSKGLGSSFLTDQMKKYYRNHLDRMYLTTPGGNRIAMPKYYRDQLFNDEEKAVQRDYISDALEKIKEKREKFCSDRGIDYDEYMDQVAVFKHKLYNFKSGKNRKKL